MRILCLDTSYFFIFGEEIPFKARGVKHWVLGYANVTLSSLLQALKCYGETLWDFMSPIICGDMIAC